LPTFVFTGTMDYIPNVDAVCWFVGEILPVIRQTLSTAQFYVVGANPSAAVRQLSRTGGVHVTGRVPDVRPYLAHATAVVAPMRIARGIQNKVMEAMSMAKPVIVTSDALEGIDAVIGEELFLADDAISFAMTACKLAENADQGTQIGAAARRRMVGHFSWEAQLRRFDLLLSRSGR
jgi:glycosyltransferase involved in cell wall biosynthesis